MERYLRKIKEIVKKARYLSIEIAFLEFVSALLGIKGERGKKWAYYKHEAVKKYIRRKYGKNIKKLREQPNNSTDIQSNCPIWIFWAQGMKNAPWIVQDCYRSVEKWMSNHEIIVISRSNLKKYLEIPEEILSKVQNKTIPLTQFSDYIRLNLLKKYGGIWLDATVFLTGNIDFLIRGGVKFYSVAHGRDKDTHVCKGKWMTSVLACGLNSKLFDFCGELIEIIMIKEHVYPTYLMLDCLIAIAYEECIDVKKDIDACPENQTEIDLLIKNLKRTIDDLNFIRSSHQIIHKLSYKGIDDDKTNYQKNLLMVNLDRI